MPTVLEQARRSIDEPVNVNYNTYSWKLDQVNKRVTGQRISGLELLDQSIDLEINIKRNGSYMHSDYFGSEIYKLIGKQQDYCNARIENIVKDALNWDDRIISVSNFTYEDLKNGKALVTFDVETIYGSLNKEVTIDV